MPNDLAEYRSNITFRGTLTISFKGNQGLSRAELIQELISQVDRNPDVLFFGNVCHPESWMFEDSWEHAVRDQEFLFFDAEWDEID